MTCPELAQRARRRALEEERRIPALANYYWQAYAFLRGLGDAPKEELTLKQRNWLAALELDLKEVEDAHP
jgi:hypothetical protein